MLRRLYAILDADACAARGLPLEDVGVALCRAAPAILQLRAKGRSASEVLALVSILRRSLVPGQTQLFLNDRADLAELGGCDGVHVGQSDLPVASVRRHFPRLRVGVSTHSEMEFEEALSERPDYVALGPIFPTASKENPEPTLGLSELVRLAPRARKCGIPLVAIGGIDRGSAASIAEHARYVAVISALLPSGPRVPASLDSEVADLAVRFERELEASSCSDDASSLEPQSLEGRGAPR